MNCPRLITLIVASLFIVSCVKTCVGIGELGSKERPLLFSLEGWHSDSDSTAAFNAIQDCMEKSSGYRVGFEIYADPSAVVRSLKAKRAQFGLLDSISFVSEGLGQGLVPLYIVGENRDFAKRAVIVGSVAQNSRSFVDSSLHFSKSSWALSLQKAHQGTFAYLTQDSAEGFLVPRHMMLDVGVLPDAAIFAGNWEVVEELVRGDKVDMGVLSEEYIKQNWEIEEAKIGLAHDGVIILAISPPFPKRVMAANADLSTTTINAITNGLMICATGADRSAIEKTFSGVQFERADLDDFAFLKEITEFQRTFVRVLPENEPGMR